MKLRLNRPLATVLAVWLGTAAATAHAAIAKGLATTGANAAFNGNGELFLATVDPVAKVSYVLDLGITLNSFFVDGQLDAGTQRFFVVDDANWADFIGQVTPQNLQWAVMGRDVTGGTAVGGQRLFTTVKQGSENLLVDINPSAQEPFTTNLDFVNAIGEGRIGPFFDSVNTSGTHGGTSALATHGSSVNRESDPNQAYFGKTLRTQPLGLDFSVVNALGQSSWFYYLTRSGPEQGAMVLLDEFDNLGHDGYWGFTYVAPSVDSPYAGKYLLSYTLQAAGASAAQREFANSVGRSEWGGGFAVTRLGLATTAGQESPALAFEPQRLAAVAVVPEPAATAQLLLGLAGLARLARLRRR
jgi:hypothetical protein